MGGPGAVVAAARTLVSSQLAQGRTTGKGDMDRRCAYRSNDGDVEGHHEGAEADPYGDRPQHVTVKGGIIVDRALCPSFLVRRLIVLGSRNCCHGGGCHMSFDVCLPLRDDILRVAIQ
jgi:hypothetical protein